MKKKQIVFIVNPISGIRKKECVPDVIERYLDKDIYDAQILYTEYAGHARGLAQKAIADGTDVIVAVGGDGSVNEVAKELINTNVTMGIIPYGSGNGLANYLNIPLNNHKAIELLNKCNTMAIDTISINDDLSVSIAGIGFDALVAKLFSTQKTRGFFTYLRIVAGEYLSYRPKKYTLTYNGETIVRRALFISFANSDQFGYNTTIAPDAKINDGLIDVCIVKKIPLFRIPYLAHMLFLKRIHKTKFVELIKTDEIFVSRKKNRVINIDGESKKLEKELHFKVNHLSLKVIVP